jgi:hypothetical protein
MNKCKTKRELINNDYVSHINREYQYGVVDGYDYIYYLYLQNGYWFKEEQTSLIAEPTISRLISRFNEMTISKRTDKF